MTKTATAPEAPSWAHKGYTITFDPNRGEFNTTHDGMTHRGPSLDAIKKKIDGLLANKFEPFTALDLRFYVEGYRRNDPAEPSIRQVAVSAVHGKGGRGRETVFVGETTQKVRYGRSNEFTVLHPDTPECRAAYAAYMDLCVKNAKAKKEMEHAESTLKAKIPQFVAWTFVEAGNRIVVEFPDPPTPIRLDD